MGCQRPRGCPELFAHEACLHVSRGEGLCFQFLKGPVAPGGEEPSLLRAPWVSSSLFIHSAA